jgi:hypothetical protein
VKLPRPLSVIMVCAFVATLPLLNAACTSNDSSDNSGLIATAAQSTEDSLSVLLLARDVDVHDNRIPMLVMTAGSESAILEDRAQEMTFSYKNIDDADFKLLPNVTWRPWPVRSGVYTGVPAFDRSGIWEFQAQFTENGHTRTGSAFLQVAEDSKAPGIGDPARPSITKTAISVDEVKEISSALTPDTRFYSESLDKALANGKPTVVLFSTPAFCVSQTCGPQLDTLGKLADAYAGRINFIHVEVFDNISEMLETGDNSIGVIAQPVNDWGLVTEPFTFFIDANGIVTARFEQFTTLEELQQAAETALGAG